MNYLKISLLSITSKCWKESINIELLPTWNIITCQYKINISICFSFFCIFFYQRYQLLFSLQPMNAWFTLLEECKQSEGHVFWFNHKAFESVPHWQLIDKFEENFFHSQCSELDKRLPYWPSRMQVVVLYMCSHYQYCHESPEDLSGAPFVPCVHQWHLWWRYF